MTWFRCGGIPVTLKNAMNAVLNKKFGTSGQNYPPNGWPDDVNLLGPLPEKTAAGSIAHITDGADGVPVKNWLVTLPASLDGYSEVNAVRSGKNLLLPHNADIAETTLNGIKRSYSLDNQEFTFDGTNTKTDAGWLIYAINTSDFVLNGLKSGVTYRFSHNLTADFYAQITYNKSGGGVGDMGYLRGNAGRNASVSFTLPSDFSSLRQFQIGVVNTATDVDITAHFQIEVGSTATAYEAYEAPTQYTASLGRTIYGGTADIVTGEGKTKVYRQTFTGDNISSVSITYGQADTGYTHLYFYTSGIPVAYNPSGANVVTDIGVPMSAQASQSAIPAMGECFNLINTGSGANQRPTIYWYTNQTWSNIEDFKTWLNANPITVVYEVADENGNAFTFTPITAETALGVNNFWADEGDSDVTYRADISLALQSLQGSRSLSASLMRSEGTDLEERSEDPEEVSELEENIQNTEEQEGENDER